ncbi:MAG TPA: ribosome small subunit-dependent GTPase A [Flavobacteriales bacterium]|nr:ribosome small subunit-dependent GTPase A [Flavobacteriales bacterium]
MEKGTVYKSTGSWYNVKLESTGNFVEARIKGKFRIKGIRSTNPVAVGDKVFLTPDNHGTYIITDIEERKNYLLRKSINLSKKYHILAANVDQVIILISLINPKTYTAFIDRILVSAEAFHIPPILVFNKIDLYKNDEELSGKLTFLTDTYTKIGYRCLHTSVTQKTGLDEFAQILKNKTGVLIGHSGVGKSSIINSIYPNLNLKTGDISKQHHTGKHTTTFAEMYDLDTTTRIIDTPGVRGFGLIDFDKNELSHYFPEMREKMQQCKFNNCVHINEPGCAVKQALETGGIAEFRYLNYLSMYFDDEDETFRSKGY